MKWRLSGAEVIGGNRPLDPRVPFAHARVVLRRQRAEASGEEEYLLVYGYPSPEEAEGDTLTRDEWVDLIAAGEAHRLPDPLPAKPNGTLWVLGLAFPKSEHVVEALNDAGALIESVEVTDGVLVCYVKENSVGAVRKRFAMNATFLAWSAILEKKEAEAVRHAERALAIGGMSPESIALLALLYKRQGREARSKGYLRMALDSRGEQFYRETLKEFKKYSGSVPSGDEEVPPAANENGRAKKEFEQALKLARHQKWDEALPHALRALDADMMSPAHFALVALLYDRKGDEQNKDRYLVLARIWHGSKFYGETLKKYRDFSTVSDRPVGDKTGLQPLYLILLGGVALIILVGLGSRLFPSALDVPEIAAASLDVKVVGDLLRKLSATILVYCMQFGFIAFEAGSVQENFRKHSAVKNLIVFAAAFISYIFLGWHIQRWWHHDAFSNLLDIVFNAGFASTVALIVANTITERGTLLVNTLCSMVASGVAYPILAGLFFSGGYLATRWGFVDTAGGCVVHVLGGSFGLAAALWIGPRIKRRAWYHLGKVQIGQMDGLVALAVIGAFFLWFGWLGFNSGNATSWDGFLIAFRNTNIGASAGGLVGVIIAIANQATLLTSAGSALTSGGTVRGIRRDIAKLERVILGMMGGLVAVTANAGLVKSWEALLEAIIGAIVAIVGSAWLTHFKPRLDDPLGAVATHGLAGIVGVICTAFFYDPAAAGVTSPAAHSVFGQLGVQAAGIVLAVVVGGGLATILCLVLLYAERRAKRLWTYGRLLRLTPHQQYTGLTGAEEWVPREAVMRALARVHITTPPLQGDEVQEWISAIGILALLDNPDREVEEALSKALDDVLDTSYEGKSEELAAIAAIRARADVSRLLMCVNRALEHRQQPPRPEVREWKSLNEEYRETLIVTIRDLAETFAATYRVKRVEEPLTKLESMIEGFAKACEILKEIGEDKDTDKKLRKRAEKEFLYLRRLPWYWEIIKEYKKMQPLPKQDIPEEDTALAELLHRG